MISETMAQRYCWSFKTFEHKKLYHYRTMRTATGSVLAWRFRRGVMEYTNGYHPLFQLLRFFSWMPHSSFALASLFRTAGYCLGMITMKPSALSDYLARRLKKEQVQRIKDLLYYKGGAS